MAGTEIAVGAEGPSLVGGECRADRPSPGGAGTTPAAAGCGAGGEGPSLVGGECRADGPSPGGAGTTPAAAGCGAGGCCWAATPMVSSTAPATAASTASMPTQRGRTDARRPAVAGNRAITSTP